MRVLTVLRTGGEYSERHVIWLQKQLKVPIYCLTDSTEAMPNVTTIPMKHSFPGWWSKLEMFSPDIPFENFLYTDLDAVFLDGVPDCINFLKNTTVLVHVGIQFKDTINSGLMFINTKDSPPIWDEFIKDPDYWMKFYKLEGDQGFINRHLHDADAWQIKFPGLVASYKANYLRNGSRPFTHEKIIVFHGVPRPWDVKNCEWIPKL